MVEAMGGQGDEVVLISLCRIARESLERRLRPGVRLEDCGDAFPVAAAWLVLDALENSGSLEGVESFSAGDLTVKIGAQNSGTGRAAQAHRLMAPYCREEGFAFEGVPG